MLSVILFPPNFIVRLKPRAPLPPKKFSSLRCGDIEEKGLLGGDGSMEPAPSLTTIGKIKAQGVLRSEPEEGS